MFLLKKRDNINIRHMCYNAFTSFTTFIAGIISCFVLYYHGNPKYMIDNKIFGVFFGFVITMQLFEFIFWMDNRNHWGFNHLATLLAPILTLGQPLILYACKLHFLNEMPQWNTIGIINLFYSVYLANFYTLWIAQTSNLTTTIVECGHLKWSWLPRDLWAYFATFAVNVFSQSNQNYAWFVFILGFLFLILSNFFFNYHAGELWCFFSASLPVFLYFFSWNPMIFI
jgi:hypothetical protein